MSLLQLEHVSRTLRSGRREHPLLCDICLSMDAGELVAIWGKRGSGRSTLLRIAAGIEPHDAGTVRFDGRELPCGAALGDGIGWCGHGTRGADGIRVSEEIAGALLARGLPKPVAQARATAALERAEVAHAATLQCGELDTAETVRVSIARALSTQPRLLVVDDPTAGVDLLERDGILILLRSLADEGIGVLSSAGESTALSGADRALSLSEGRLRGSLSPELADVVPLRRRAVM